MNFTFHSLNRNEFLPFSLLFFILIFFCLSFSGCSYLTTKVVRTPNYQKHFIPKNSKLLTEASSFSIPSSHKIQSNGDKAQIRFYLLNPQKGKHIGSCFLLHGYKKSSVGMLKFAKPLVLAGFQVILVDSRGCGSSMGDYLSFGINESKDLTKILDNLLTNNISQAPFFVTGISFGASTSIVFGCNDNRINSIVAIAPFSSLHEVVKHYLKLFFPIFIWMHTDSYVTKFVNELGQKGGFNPKDLELTDIVKKTKKNIFLLHGKKDCLIPCSNSEKLKNANESFVSAKYFSNLGHNSIYKDKNKQIRQLIVDILKEQIKNLIESK